MGGSGSPEGRASEVGVVLVHGACHGAWCWEEVVGPVESAGFTVHAVDLPLTTLSDDAAVVRSAVGAMRDAGLSVLVVGHSYGGVVITAAGHDADALMYCAAVMPDTGESAGSVAPTLTTAESAASAVVAADGRTFTFDPDLGAHALYGKCTAAQAESAVRRLRPMHLACFGEPIEEPAWRTVPASYVVCTEDLTVAPHYQRDRANEVGDAITLDADHSPFYSATDALVDRVIEVAGRLRGPGLTAA